MNKREEIEKEIKVICIMKLYNLKYPLSPRACAKEVSNRKNAAISLYNEYDTQASTLSINFFRNEVDELVAHLLGAIYKERDIILRYDI